MLNPPPLVQVSADGATVQWPVTPTYPLKVCRQNQWIPHIIIGHAIPPPLAASGKAGRKFGPTSWTTYDKFINTFLTYVVVEQGFTETEWEVGNEMNLPSQNWVASEAPSASTDEKGFNAYAKLYRTLQTTWTIFDTSIRARRFALVDPWKRKRAMFPPRRIGLRGVRYTSPNHVPADFVSFHAYGNVARERSMRIWSSRYEKNCGNTQHRIHRCYGVGSEL